MSAEKPVPAREIFSLDRYISKTARERRQPERASSGSGGGLGWTEGKFSLDRYLGERDILSGRGRNEEAAVWSSDLASFAKRMSSDYAARKDTYQDAAAFYDYRAEREGEMDALLRQAKETQAHYTDYASTYDQIYGSGSADKVIAGLREGMEYLEGLRESLRSEGQYWGQWDSAEEYDKWKTISTMDTAQVGQRLHEEQRKLSELKARVDAAQAAIPQYEENPQVISAIMAAQEEYERLSEEYAQGQETLRLQEQELRQAEQYQTLARYAALPDSPDFETLSRQGAESGEGFFNAPAFPLLTGGRDEVEKLAARAAATEEQRAIYHYLLAKEGEEAAGAYLDAITPGLNARAGQAVGGAITDLPVPARVPATLAMGVYAGLDQFGRGVAQIFVDEPLDPGVAAYASQTVREGLSSAGPEFFGSSLGQAAYDAVTTTANMAPSILLSYLTAGLGAPAAVAGAVGAGTLGASAGGNAYGQAMAQGYTKEQAASYGLLVGVSEAGLQYLLGGIGKLGGALTAKAARAISNIDKALLRVGADLGVHVLGEGTEEYLQEVLDPVWRNLLLDEDNEIKLVSEDAAYAFLLGAVTAGLLEGGHIVTADLNLNRTGRAIRDAGKYETLLENALALPEGSKARTLAQELRGGSRKATSMNVGELFAAYAREGGDLTFLRTAQDGPSGGPDAGETVAIGEDVLAAMERLLSGEEISRSQASKIARSAAAVAELSRRTGAEINTDAPISALKTAIQALSRQGEGISEAAETRPLVQKPPERTAFRRELDMDRIRDAAESAGFGESGRRALTAAYDGEADAAAYFAGFSVLYHAGLTGVEESKVKSPYISPLTPAQRYAAYTAGQNDAAAARSERLQDDRVDGTIKGKQYSVKGDDNGQEAGTDRGGVSLFGYAERAARKGRQAAASERGSGQDRAGIRGGQIGFRSRSQAEQSRLTEILITPVDNAPEWRSVILQCSVDEVTAMLSDAIDRDSTAIHDMMRHIPGFAKAVADARAYANRGRTVRGTSVGPAVKNATGKDSAGRALSQGQRAYFAGSRARDAQGNLLRLFHGSRTDVFTEFDLYEGVWLTGDKDYAQRYAQLRRGVSELEDQIYSDESFRMFEVYANITRPVDIGEINGPLTEEKVRELARSLGTPYAQLQGIASHYMGENTYAMTRSSGFMDLAGRLGFDGMKATEDGVETWCAIASPDQVKLTSNTDPTVSGDVRYSLKNADGDGQLSAAQRELDVGRIKDAAESSGFGQSGKRALTAAYDGEADAAAYFAVFSVLYHAGLTGVEESKVKNHYTLPLNPAQRYAAYTAGKNDAPVSLNREKGGAAYGPVRSEEAGLVPNDLVKSLPKNAARFLDALGKSAGVKIELVDRIVTPDGTDGGNGSYDPRKGVLTISINAEGVQRANGEINLQALCTVAAHEITHRIQQLAPEQYRAYRDYAVSVVGERFGGTEGAVAAKGRQYAARGVTLSAQEAMDEIAADFTREMLYHIELFRDLVRQDRSLAKWVMDGLTDFIRRVKSALSGQTAREGGAGDGYGATLSALEEAALLWQAAYDAAAAAAGSLKNTGADGIIEGKKFSTKARRGRSIEQETMENNRFERLRRFGDDLPLEWYAYTANFFYIFSNHSFTDYTIISKMRISDSNRSKIGSIMEEYESAYRTGEIVDSGTEVVQRRSGCGTRDSAVSSGTGAAGQTNALDVRAQERDDAGDPAENSGVGRRENRRKFSLKSTDSEGRQLSAAQRELDVDRIRDASESAGFGESGKRALTAAYDGEPEAAAYFAGFSVLYHAGLTGVEEGKVKSPYISPLTPAQRYAAYTAGQNDAAAARSERLQDARADGTMGTTKYSLKEELKHGGSREETRGEFLRRAAGEGYSVFEGKTTAYGYRGPVQLGHETDAWYIREELQKLGISCIITDGSVLWNRNGYTGIRQVEEAVTAQGEAIFINGETSIPAKQVAGHEAFHLWKNGTGRDAYIQTIEDNLVFTSKEFLEYQDKISKKYLGGEADLSNDTQINQLREELFAYISGHIHEGTNDDFLRPMFRRYDAVKGAWRELLRQNGADGSAFFLQGDNAAADMPQE